MRGIALSLFLTACMVAQASAAAAAPQAGGLSGAVGPRRVFSLRGFSICPPAAAQEARKGDSTSLAIFNVVDPASGQLLMTMDVIHNAERKEEVTSLADYGTKLVQQLALDQDFHAESTAPGAAGQTAPAAATAQVTTLAGKPALEIHGSVGRGSIERFRRDYWVLIQGREPNQPSQFLVIRFTGPMAQREGILAASQASAGTLELFDAAPIRARHAADRAGAEQWLASLTREKVLAAVSSQDYWLAVVRGGQVVGFMHYVESIGNQNKTPGVQVVIESALVAQDGSRLLTRQEMFSTADRVNERWEQRGVTLGADGNEASRHQQFCVKQHDRLVVQTVTGPHSTHSQVKEIPEPICLPLAFSPLLPRLLDRSAAAQYVFAQYDPVSEEVAMRVVRVVGPTNVTISGRSFAATEIEDRPDVDGPLTKLYVDGSGLPLKWVTTDSSGSQMTVQRTTAAAIAERFGPELKRFEAAPK
jgi:hypothetical protein